MMMGNLCLDFNNKQNILENILKKNILLLYKKTNVIIRWCLLIIILSVNTLYGQTTETYISHNDIGPKTDIFQPIKYNQILYVSPNGSDQEGIGSMEKPCQSISYTLSQINDAGESNKVAVCIAEGTYEESTIDMKPYVDLYGGYRASDWARDIFKNLTILSGNGKRRVIIAANNTRLDGFIVSRGVIRGKGAGILCDGTSPAISNNIFIHNKTLTPDPWEPELRHEIANDGGAICALNNAAPIIESNLFFENMTEAGRGAAIALHNNCSGRIAKNVFLYNKAGLSDPKRSSDGGAISVFEWSNPVITNNIILDNHALAQNDAGAIFSGYWSSPLIHENIIVGNTAEDDGGGIFTGGQNHHDEIPPQFDPIPDENDFFIRITDNVFVGNNQALEFSMESRGLFANNIVALNGGSKTVPAGVYFQRSEAQIVNNTILDPFLINFKTFDNKPSSEGLKPSVIRDNRIWGPFEVETQVIKANNFIREESKQKKVQFPNIKRDWLQLNADAVYYGLHIKRQIFTTKIFISTADFIPQELVNRVVRAGDRWGVVKSNDEQMIEVWGDLTGCVLFSILPTYRLSE
jgi:hypothetical protein